MFTCRPYRASCIRPRSCWSRFTVVVGNNCIWQCQQSSATSVPAADCRLCCYPDTSQPGNSGHRQRSCRWGLFKQWQCGEGEDGGWPRCYRAGLRVCCRLLCCWSWFLRWIAAFRRDRFVVNFHLNHCLCNIA